MRRVLALGCAAFLVAGAGTEPPPAVKPPAPRVVQEMAPEHAEPILGRPVNGADGKELGRLVDVLVTGDGEPQAAVIDFGGFLGVGNRRIAVRWDTMHFTPTDPQHAIVLDMTMDEIKAAPAYGSASKPVQVVTPELALDPATADTTAKHDAAPGAPGAATSGAGAPGAATSGAGASGAISPATESTAPGTAGPASGSTGPVGGTSGPSAGATGPASGATTPTAGPKPATPGATPPAAGGAGPATGSSSEPATSTAPR